MHYVTDVLVCAHKYLYVKITIYEFPILYASHLDTDGRSTGGDPYPEKEWVYVVGRGGG